MASQHDSDASASYGALCPKNLLGKITKQCHFESAHIFIRDQIRVYCNELQEDIEHLAQLTCEELLA